MFLGPGLCKNKELGTNQMVFRLESFGVCCWVCLLQSRSFHIALFLSVPAPSMRVSCLLLTSGIKHTKGPTKLAK